MRKHRGISALSWLCEVLHVSRGGYHGWLKRPGSDRAKQDEQLLAGIRRSLADSDHTYGARRVRHDLRARGELCGIHRVERLMLSAGIEARRKRRRVPGGSGQRPADALAANVLDREFVAAAPNQRWVADFTYLWTDVGWLYEAVVLDLYSCLVVGCSIQSSMAAQLVSHDMLLWSDAGGRLPSSCIIRTQYSSDPIQQLVAEHGVICSMSRSGSCRGNAATESFSRL
jgi:putative transposase